jgi:hypothetical protein
MESVSPTSIGPEQILVFTAIGNFFQYPLQVLIDPEPDVFLQAIRQFLALAPQRSGAYSGHLFAPRLSREKDENRP